MAEFCGVVTNQEVVFRIDYSRLILLITIGIELASSGRLV